MEDRDHRYTVLVYDTSPDNLVKARQCLKKYGINVITAGAPEEAMHAFEHRHIDFVITEVRWRIKEDMRFVEQVVGTAPDRNRLPIVTTSDPADSDAVCDSLESMGVILNLTKPLVWPTVASFLRANFGLNKAS